MRLSVLIPVYNRRAQLAQCLDALARQTLPREEFEVIVCDDGSDDQPETLAADFASALDLKFVRRPHANRAAALNGGFEAARGDVIVFTDSDMVPTPSLLEKHRDFHRRDPRPQAAMLGYMDWYPGLTVTRFMRHIVSDSAWQFGYTTLTDGGVVTWGYFYGGNTSVKREFLAAHGVHDESFARAEDVELGYRLSQAGMELVYDASAVNYHNHFVTVRDFARRNQNVGRALVHFARRHPELTGHLPVFAGAALARETERRGLTIEGLVAKIEAIEGIELSPAEEAEIARLYEIVLAFSLGQGIREALWADFEQASAPATVIVPSGRVDESLPAPLRDRLLALERVGYEFLLFRTTGSDGVALDPTASLGAEVLHACQAAAVRASGKHLCFVHRADLDDRRLTTLAEAIAREPEAGLVIDRLVAGRDAVVIPRPVFFECGGFGKAGGDAAFGWRLLEQLGVMGYRPRDVATSGERSPEA